MSLEKEGWILFKRCAYKIDAEKEKKYLKSHGWKVRIHKTSKTYYVYKKK